MFLWEADVEDVGVYRSVATLARVNQFERLTGREVDVIKHVAEGRTNREIGSHLFLSEGTVRNYASSAFAKLGVSRRSEAAALVVRLGLVR